MSLKPPSSTRSGQQLFFATIGSYYSKMLKFNFLCLFRASSGSEITGSNRKQPEVNEILKRHVNWNAWPLITVPEALTPTANA